jgi:putative membrane protein
VSTQSRETLGDATPASGAGATPDRSTELSEQRTALSIERSFLAFERTLMAWLRTSLSMIGFGFTLVKFFEYLAEQRGGAVVGRFGRTWASDSVGLTMIAIGTVALVIAVIQHKRRIDALRGMGLVPQWNLALGVASLVAVLGVFAFASLVLGA